MHADWGVRSKGALRAFRAEAWAHSQGCSGGTEPPTPPRVAPHHLLSAQLWLLTGTADVLLRK